MPKSCSPIVKWVGGKRQLLTRINELLPSEYGTYYEPFFGGGAVFFHIAPERAVINDFNVQLMNLYFQAKNALQELMRLLDFFQDTYNRMDKTEQCDYYQQLRRKYNHKIEMDENDVEMAALFVFLNKTGYNGLYRVNSNGQFNVPFSHRKSVNLYDKDNIKLVHEALKKAEIMCGDFEKACQNAVRGDFVFFDSPYFDTFDAYQSKGFSRNDHERLARLFKELSGRGVYCLLTNSNTDFIKSLYQDYIIEVVPVKRMVNRDASKRTGEEVIIRNYETQRTH